VQRRFWHQKVASSLFVKMNWMFRTQRILNLQAWEKDYLIEIDLKFKQSIAYGCLVVCKAVDEIVKDGFKVTGQVPLNYETMLGSSYADIDKEMRQNMNKRMEIDVPLFLTQGMLTEEQ